jgi:hypothetical protein
LNTSRAIQARQFAAALLLLVFVFIHLGKALHIHRHSVQQYRTEAAQEFKVANDCAVCDFHFSKDGDPVPVAITFAAPVGFSNFTCCYQSFNTASIGLVYADRGPPASA